MLPSRLRRGEEDYERMDAAISRHVWKDSGRSNAATSGGKWEDCGKRTQPRSGCMQEDCRRPKAERPQRAKDATWDRVRRDFKWAEATPGDHL